MFKKALRRLGRFFVWICATVGFVILAAAFVGVLALTRYEATKQAEPDTILELYLTGSLPSSPPGPLALLSGGGLSLDEITQRLRAAGRDQQVSGLYLRLVNSQITLSQAQELHKAVQDFRAQGKEATIWADSFGEVTPDISAYLLATAFDAIYLQPVGQVHLGHLASDVPFFAATLERIGIHMEVVRREEYKTLLDSFTDHAMSPAFRDNLLSLLQDLEEQIITQIATARGLEREVILQALAQGALDGASAQELGFIDALAHEDVVRRIIRGDVPTLEDLPTELPEDGWIEIKTTLRPLLLLAQYRPPPARRHKTLQPPPQIALIHATGALARPGGDAMPTSGAMMDTDRLIRGLRDAAEEDDIQAIILRLDSPGGSAIASETVRRAITQAAERKPVIISIMRVAGSGGYWVATGGTEIIAAPASITGSIGVIGARPDLSGLLDHLGITMEHVATGETALALRIAEPMGEAERAAWEAQIEKLYQHFLTRVSEARDLSMEETRAVAGGRIWTGQQAQKIGLVDHLGGLDMTMRRVNILLGRMETAPLHLVPYPGRRSLQEELQQLFSGGLVSTSLHQRISAFSLYLQSNAHMPLMPLP